MLAGVDQIREVIAFPKTQRGQDRLVQAPSPVTEQQLRDLHIKLRDAPKTAQPLSTLKENKPGASAPAFAILIC